MWLHRRLARRLACHLVDLPALPRCSVLLLGPLQVQARPAQVRGQLMWMPPPRVPVLLPPPSKVPLLWSLVPGAQVLWLLQPPAPAPARVLHQLWQRFSRLLPRSHLPLLSSNDPQPASCSDLPSKQQQKLLTLHPLRPHLCCRAQPHLRPLTHLRVCCHLRHLTRSLFHV